MELAKKSFDDDVGGGVQPITRFIFASEVEAERHHGGVPPKAREPQEPAPPPRENPLSGLEEIGDGG